MKYGFIFVLTLLISLQSSAQQGFPKYYELIAHWTKGDSAFRAQDYKKAGFYFEKAAEIPVEKGIDMDYAGLRYGAAAAWALAGKRANAFRNLRLITTQMAYSNWQRLTGESAFAALHTDKQWASVIDRARSNADIQERYEAFVKQRTTFKGSTPEVLFAPLTSKMRDYVANDSFPFLSINHANFRIHFRGDSYSAQHLNTLKQQTDVALRRILSVLQVADYHKGVHLVLVDSAGELQALSGMKVQGGLALPQHDLVFILNNGKRQIQLKHEVFHFISNDVWGPCNSRLLNEGSAVFVQNDCNNYDNPVYSITAYLSGKGKLFPLQSLVSNFDQLAAENEVIAYYQSAAVFKYLYDTYGVEKIKRLWVKGFDQFESIYGIGLPALEKALTGYLSQIPAPENMDWETLRKEGC